MKIDISHEVPDGWDAYVDGHPDATAYHRSEAVLIAQESFGLDTYFLTARSDGMRLAGVLPLVEQSSLVFGRFLTSLPFFTYGGILADGENAAHELAAAATDLAQTRRAKHVEFRHRSTVLGQDYSERTEKVSMVLELPADEEALAKELGSKLRSQIRRAEREEPEIVWGGAELISEFYSIFAAGMHALGTPVYPRRFFEVVMQAINFASLIVVRVDGKAEAAAIVIRHGRQVEVPWAAASLWGKRNAINMRMYWEMLRAAVADGASAFDFGRSTVDSGTHRFKAQWGAKARQLRWHYWLPDGASMPRLNHSNPKYELAIRAWQRMPLWFVNLLGPRISRNLP